MNRARLYPLELFVKPDRVAPVSAGARISRESVDSILSQFIVTVPVVLELNLPWSFRSLRQGSRLYLSTTQLVTGRLVLARDIPINLKLIVGRDETRKVN